ncbi:intraflagellar transport protein 57 homolog [Harpegnathos saltator]|uniref:Intraflagellar transport protein 57-like protein n=1 Tax=Harpegnathos saltator TaxID=610380 RepID=E2C7F4_HARSA|nr:intraflagellar transport protein 57 homolog [Harpegnathos saltator]XP_011152024.1 intraflagellar transport protein 57 homolog [Harpegnathos saltator]XP_011152025.1 intraflagellar transport protein 57 homolog [Harpegnathos saltator]XP_011152026.1 intraflagellar transport protein 57 homolog [Harpegnathos saltator]XP_011152027.1 intraflagellar transport protein 57 homolog [Harpegnathos saltator]EFN76141.1 Intraflagellar transport protein 57-like protein [Harpegnathos saltator]
MFRDTQKIIIEDALTPSAPYVINVRMEDLLEKLKLLNYDAEFVQDLKIKPINRHYFVIPTNPGEQFYTFTCLAAWLIRKAGKNFEMPQESDDPNSMIALILDYLRDIDIPIEFPPNKLKQGTGEHAVYVLDNLADNALKIGNFKWNKVSIPPDESTPEPDIEDDDAELILEKVEEEMMAEYDDEDQDMLHVDDITKFYSQNTNEGQKPDSILESKTSRDEWQLELEKVLPRLKVTVKTDSRDWRAHLEQMKQLRANIATNLSGTKTQLSKIYTDIENTLDKIKTRETYLNRQLESSLTEYRMLQEELSKVKEQYRDVSGGVTERTRVLSKLMEELEHVKKEMDERGSSMTDGTPLINIKKTITKMKNEISEMNVRIGVLEYSLMCARVRDRTQLREDMNSTSASVII